MGNKQDLNIETYDYYIGTAVQFVNNNIDFTVNTNPFGNCQIATIAYFGDLLRECLGYKIKTLLKYVYDHITSKPILLLDLNIEVIPLFNKEIKDEFIVFQKEYTSTNDSKMVICMLLFRDYINSLENTEAINDLFELKESYYTVEDDN